tara:strand:+ start:966 stop:1190 length:225 start_codon:yes stop_codon:yes gene_type:complete
MNFCSLSESAPVVILASARVSIVRGRVRVQVRVRVSLGDSTAHDDEARREGRYRHVLWESHESASGNNPAITDT